MNIDIDGLIELAKKATPGFWSHRGMGVIKAGPVIEFSNGSDQQQIFMATGAEWMRHGEKEANANFVSAVNPATILALCERLREAESAMKLSLKLLQDGEVDSAIDQIEEALNPEVSDE